LHDGIALLTGGSYSQWASLPASHILPLPKSLSYVQGAAIPEAWSTAFQLLRLASVKMGDDVVVYAGASGVGTAAIQLCKLLGAHPWAVVSTKEKGKICEELGAKGVVYYKDNKSWHKELIEQRGSKGGFNSVLDCVGPSNVEATL
jgi:tumor protein p53-inducible protein 3